MLDAVHFVTRGLAAAPTRSCRLDPSASSPWSRSGTGSSPTRGARRSGGGVHLLDHRGCRGASGDRRAHSSCRPSAGTPRGRPPGARIGESWLPWSRPWSLTKALVEQDAAAADEQPLIELVVVDRAWTDFEVNTTARTAPPRSAPQPAGPTSVPAPGTPAPPAPTTPCGAGELTFMANLGSAIQPPVWCPRWCSRATGHDTHARRRRERTSAHSHDARGKVCASRSAPHGHCEGRFRG